MDARHRPDHARATHTRWMARRNRKQGSPEYEESWRAQQCGSCEFWIPLAGKWGSDYGGCSNPESPHDGSIRFEHDGCEFHSPGEVWGIPQDF